MNRTYNVRRYLKTFKNATADLRAILAFFSCCCLNKNIFFTRRNIFQAFLIWRGSFGNFWWKILFFDVSIFHVEFSNEGWPFQSNEVKMIMYISTIILLLLTAYYYHYFVRYTYANVKLNKSILKKKNFLENSIVHIIHKYITDTH